MPKKILVVGEITFGGEWGAAKRLLQTVKKIRPDTQISFLGYAGTDKTQGIFKKIIKLKHHVSKPPLSFFKRLYLDFADARKNVKKLQNGENYDFIFSTDYLMIISAFLAKKKGVRTIFLFEGIKSTPVNKFSDIGLRSIVVGFLETFAFLTADTIIACSESANQYIKGRICHLPVIKNPVLIPNFVDPVFFNKTPKKEIAALRKSLGFPVNRPVVMYSGRLVRKKGLDCMLQAFSGSALGENSPKLLIVYPETDMEKDYSGSIIKTAKSNPKIKLVPNPKPRVLRTLYQLADVLLLPSEIEFAPLSVIEGMASGTPFIATPQGNMKEILSKLDPNLILMNNSPEEIRKKINYFFSLSDKKRISLSIKSETLANNFLPANHSDQVSLVFGL